MVWGSIWVVLHSIALIFLFFFFFFFFSFYNGTKFRHFTVSLNNSKSLLSEGGYDRGCEDHILCTYQLPSN